MEAKFRAAISFLDMNGSAAPRDDSPSFEVALARLQMVIEEACVAEPDWPHSVAAAVCAGLDFAMADPGAARALTSDALAHGMSGVDRHDRLVAYLCRGLAMGRRDHLNGSSLPAITEKAMAGGVLSLVTQRLDCGRAAELPALAPDVVQFVLTPFLGHTAAQRVALGRG